MEFDFWALLFLMVLTANLVPDYLSLLESRLLLGLMLKTTSPLRWILLLLLDLLVTSWIAIVAVHTFIGANLTATLPEGVDRLTAWWSWVGLSFPQAVLHPITSANKTVRDMFSGDGVRNGPLFFYPAFFTSIWLWLYAGSGFLLKAARRFDIGFDWFNRHFDINQQPNNRNNRNNRGQ